MVINGINNEPKFLFDARGSKVKIAPSQTKTSVTDQAPNKGISLSSSPRSAVNKPPLNTDPNVQPDNRLFTSPKAQETRADESQTPSKSRAKIAKISSQLPKSNISEAKLGDPEKLNQALANFKQRKARFNASTAKSKLHSNIVEHNIRVAGAHLSELASKKVASNAEQPLSKPASVAKQMDNINRNIQNAINKFKKLNNTNNGLELANRNTLTKGFSAPSVKQISLPDLDETLKSAKKDEVLTSPSKSYLKAKFVEDNAKKFENGLDLKKFAGLEKEGTSYKDLQPKLPAELKNTFPKLELKNPLNRSSTVKSESIAPNELNKLPIPILKSGEKGSFNPGDKLVLPLNSQGTKLSTDNIKVLTKNADNSIKVSELADENIKTQLVKPKTTSTSMKVVEPDNKGVVEVDVEVLPADTSLENAVVKSTSNPLNVALRKQIRQNKQAAFRQTIDVKAEEMKSPPTKASTPKRTEAGASQANNLMSRLKEITSDNDEVSSAAQLPSASTQSSPASQPLKPAGFKDITSNVEKEDEQANTRPKTEAELSPAVQAQINRLREIQGLTANRPTPQSSQPIIETPTDDPFGALDYDDSMDIVEVPKESTVRQSQAKVNTPIQEPINNTKLSIQESLPPLGFTSEADIKEAIKIANNQTDTELTSNESSPVSVNLDQGGEIVKNSSDSGNAVKLNPRPSNNNFKARNANVPIHTLGINQLLAPQQPTVYDPNKSVLGKVKQAAENMKNYFQRHLGL
jgi:hypothetical protein